MEIQQRRQLKDKNQRKRTIGDSFKIKKPTNNLQELTATWDQKNRMDQVWTLYIKQNDYLAGPNQMLRDNTTKGWPSVRKID